MLEAGFTTVRDVGNAGNYADTDLRRAIEEGVVPGPTVLNAGRIIAPTGGQFPPRLPPFYQELFGASEAFIGVLNHERPGLGNPEYYFADTRDELKKAVRENVLYGARLIKVVVDDQPFIYSADDLKFVVEEADRAGLKVAAHCLTDAGARAAAEAQVASIEHGFLVSDETLALMKKNGVTLVGTDFTEQAGRDQGMPPGQHTRVVERLRRAYRAGVTLAFGTDIFVPSPGLTRGEMALTFIDSNVEAGLPPLAILQQMTTNSARLLGVEKERGAIRPGLAADLIAMPGNPLEDIQALKRISLVMKDGRVIRRD
jgi:imidazolonepropionase-like amidohydrolase